MGDGIALVTCLHGYPCDMFGYRNFVSRRLADLLHAHVLIHVNVHARAHMLVHVHVHVHVHVQAQAHAHAHMVWLM